MPLPQTKSPSRGSRKNRVVSGKQRPQQRTRASEESDIQAFYAAQAGSFDYIGAYLAGLRAE